jgi:hypothetical protein
VTSPRVAAGSDEQNRDDVRDRPRHLEDAPCKSASREVLMPLSLPASVSAEERAYLESLRPSRIRELQAGRLGWTAVDILDVEEAGTDGLRLVLERFGVRVRRFPVGQARHLVAALGGEASAPYVIVACHGAEGRVILPELDDELERFQPLHGSVGPDELRGIVRLSAGAVVISTGCDTGTDELARAYFEGGAAAYVAPRGAPFGYASTFAPLMLFYELTEGRSLDDAVARLRAHDAELSIWEVFRP